MNRCARRPHIWRLLALQGLVCGALLVSGCPYQESDETTETVVVKMNGSCAAGERTFEIRRSSFNITLTVDNPDADASTGPDGSASGGTARSLGLPVTGAIGQKESPIRQGGWKIWGCLTGQEPCASEFRLCLTERVGFQLNVSCLDSTGAVACEAVLTE